VTEVLFAVPRYDYLFLHKLSCGHEFPGVVKFGQHRCVHCLKWASIVWVEQKT